METIKSAIGLGRPAESSGKEPVNAQQGAGTAVEPYDQGNQEENVPAVTDAAANTTNDVNAEAKAVNNVSSTTATDDKALTALPGVSPSAAAIVSDGAEPVDATGASDSVPAPKAVGASTTKTVGELGDTSTTADSSNVAPKSEESKTAASPATQKDKSIGAAGWFKNTLQRRKSKGKPLDLETEKGPKVPEKDYPPKQSTSVGFVDTTKEQKESPVVETKDKKEDSAPVKEKKHKRGKSVSETLKSANIFKRRQSKADPTKDEATKQETKKETKAEQATAVPVALGTDSFTKSTSAEGPAATNATTSDKPFSTTDAAPTATSTSVPVSRYADEEVAPDELPTTTASKGAAVDETPSTSGAPVNTTATADKTVSEQTDSVPTVTTTAPENTVPVEQTAPKVETATPVDTAPSVSKELSPNDSSTTGLVDDPSTGNTIPTLNVPAAETHKAGKSPVVDDAQYPTAKGENLSAIPTAGGIRLGTRAMEERRVSQDIRRKSFVPGDVKPVQSTAKPVQSTQVPETSKTAATNHPANNDVPSRRLSVFDKLKGKLKN